MHRSSSSTRVSDEFFSNSSSSSPYQSFNPNSDTHQLPTYNPLSEVAKKERSRLRSAETAVHIIPVLLVLCAIILWYFSSPVDMVNKADSIVARVEGPMTYGGINSHGAKGRLFSNMGLEDVDTTNQSVDQVDQKPTR
ncbi:unnamed protein product [Ilex paraguariensis]|uniref:Transmembrane protein n=1 Tax=Ilex paraguariensis TaxID=185542 RepID=A0ABC8UVE2_9AQUA